MEIFTSTETMVKSFQGYRYESFNQRYLLFFYRAIFCCSEESNLHFVKIENEYLDKKIQEIIWDNLR